MNDDDIDDVLDLAIPSILEALKSWTHQDSEWVLDHVELMWLDKACYQPLRDGSYILLPKAVTNKKAVINVKNEDDDRPSSYPKEDNLDFKGIKKPTPISQIKKFEKYNNVALNVFGWDYGINVHIISGHDGPIINLYVYKTVTHNTWIKNLTVCSMIRVNIRSANISVKGVCTATREK